MHRVFVLWVLTRPHSQHVALFWVLVSFLKKYLLLLYAHDYLPACMGALSRVHKGQKQALIPWNWSYRWLWATMLMLETKPRSYFASTSSALNCWATSLGPLSPYGWKWSHPVAQAGLELTWVLVPQSPECRDSRHMLAPFCPLTP